MVQGKTEMQSQTSVTSGRIWMMLWCSASNVLDSRATPEGKINLQPCKPRRKPEPLDTRSMHWTYGVPALRALTARATWSHSLFSRAKSLACTTSETFLAGCLTRPSGECNPTLLTKVRNLMQVACCHVKEHFWKSTGMTGECQ